jgi:hypothetical protein
MAFWTLALALISFMPWRMTQAETLQVNNAAEFKYPAFSC